MAEEGLNSIVYSKNVIEFVTVASQYCSFLERAGELRTSDFLGKVQKLLALVYLKASLLPDAETELDETPEKFVTEIDYNLIRQKVVNLLGEYDDYQEVFDTRMQFSEAALTASISEDLADVYQDLKDFVTLFQIGNELVMEEGLFECSNNFRQFWGQKLVNCLRAVHKLVYSDINFDEETKITFRKDDDDEVASPDWLNRKFTNQDD